MQKRPFTISERVLGKKLENEWVFLHLDDGVYYGLNETGSLVWDALEQGCGLKEIVDRLHGLFGLDRAALQSGVEKLLRELVHTGILRTENPSA